MIPTPQEVKLEESDVEVGGGWMVEGEAGVGGKELLGELKGRGGGAPGVVRLAVKAGAGIQEQGYRLRIGDGLIEITGGGTNSAS